MGILWITNHINPAQEHLATNILRQKIIYGIEKTPAITKYTKRIVLFLPEGEFHEIGLLFVHFLLKQNGIFVDYLGANVPMVDLEYLVKEAQVDYLFCHLTSPAKKFKFNSFLSTSLYTQIPGNKCSLFDQVLESMISLSTLYYYYTI